MTLQEIRPMPAKIEPGGKGRIPYLLRLAFKEAQEGDADTAVAYWRQAVSEGYKVQWRTKREFMYQLRINRDRDIQESELD